VTKRPERNQRNAFARSAARYLTGEGILGVSVEPGKTVVDAAGMRMRVYSRIPGPGVSPGQALDLLADGKHPPVLIALREREVSRGIVLLRMEDFARLCLLVTDRRGTE